MKHVVLARKWRPQSFEEVVGQGSALESLAYLLSHAHRHPAILLSGMRGVGKTTLARLFAKGLNCQLGVTPNPCRICVSCQAIQKGEHVDVLEVDAASKAKVEDIRELLGNVGYAPSLGRFKVYLLDEAHMLSRHSFNALLKVLEEPPAHIQFILATTEPSKIPETVRSRLLCLPLQPLSDSEVAKQLAHVLSQEGRAYEEEACLKLAQASGGSLRDALTLTHQALAMGHGRLDLKVVQGVLGHECWGLGVSILSALAKGCLDGAFEALNAIEVSYKTSDALLSNVGQLLQHLLLRRHRLGLELLGEFAALEGLMASRSSEQLVRAYQAVVAGRRDLGFAPCLKVGLEMALLQLYLSLGSPKGDEFPHLGGVAPASRPPADQDALVRPEASPPTRRARPPAQAAPPSGERVDWARVSPVAASDGPTPQSKEPAATGSPNRGRDLEGGSSSNRERSSAADSLPVQERSHSEASVCVADDLAWLASWPGYSPSARKLLSLPLTGLARQLVWWAWVQEVPERTLRVLIHPKMGNLCTQSARSTIERAWALQNAPVEFHFEVGEALPYGAPQEFLEALRVKERQKVERRLMETPLGRWIQNEGTVNSRA